MWMLVRVKLSDLMLGPDGRPTSTRALSPKAAAKLNRYGSHLQFYVASLEELEEVKLLPPPA